MRQIALAGQRITIALAGTAHTAIALAGTRPAVAVGGQRTSALQLAGVRRSAIVLTGTVAGYTAGQVGALWFNDSRNSHWIAWL